MNMLIERQNPGFGSTRQGIAATSSRYVDVFGWKCGTGGDSPSRHQSPKNQLHNGLVSTTTYLVLEPHSSLLRHLLENQWLEQELS